MYKILEMLKKGLPILACLLLALFASPARALDSGLTSDQSHAVIGVIILIVLVAAIIHFNLLGWIVALGGLAICALFGILFFPFSLFFVVPLGFGGCFWGYRYLNPPLYGSSYSSNTIYSPSISEHHHHHYPPAAAPEREVVYIPVPYEKPASLPRADQVSFLSLLQQKQPAPRSCARASLEYDDQDDESHLTF